MKAIKKRMIKKKKQSEYAVFSQLEWTLLQVCVSYPCISRSAREKRMTKEKTLQRVKAGEISQQTVSCSKDSPLL